jgi:hypothetical protein
MFKAMLKKSTVRSKFIIKMVDTLKNYGADE